MAYPFTVTAEYRQDRSVFVTLAVPPGDPSAAWAASVEPKPDGSGWIVRPSAARPRPCADRLTAVLLAVSLAEKAGGMSPDAESRHLAGRDTPPDIARPPLPDRLELMLRVMCGAGRFVPSRDRALVFGSVGEGSPDPKDLDVYLDFRDMPAEDLFRRRDLFGPWLGLARRNYGWLDVFVDTAGGLYVRDDEATGWAPARNVRAIRAAGRKGLPLAAFGLFSAHDMPADAAA
jgi:hypothetical protein